MGWVKLDDGWAAHPKMLAAGVDGRALWLESVCYCSRQLTDGKFPASALQLICVTAGVPSEQAHSLAARLVELDAWETDGANYFVHGYLDWQRSREQVEHERQQARDRQAKRRASLTANDVTDESRRDSPRDFDRESRLSSQTASRYTEAEAEADKTHTRGGDPYAAGFAAWYDAYPRKVAKQAGRKAYVARRRAGVAHDDLLLAAQRYAAQCRRAGTAATFIKHPATFLNNGWDEHLPGGAVDVEHRQPAAQSSWEVPW